MPRIQDDSTAKALQSIRLRGVHVHNLKSIDLELPHGQLIVLCGVSGSGKSSLAFDTLYAEGQRRYIESFSAYSRQFLERLERPAAEHIDGIPPAIAVTRQHAARRGRGTVGTTTEINDYLQLLFSRLGQVICRGCGQLVCKDHPESVVAKLAQLPEGTRFLVTFPVFTDTEENRFQLLHELREQGFSRLIAGNRTVHLNDAASVETARRQLFGEEHAATTEPLYAVVDRLSAGGPAQRLRDSLETAFQQGAGRVTILHELGRLPGGVDAQQGLTVVVDETAWQRLEFSDQFRCDRCALDYVEPEPRLFNFNSPLGACPDCEGAGGACGRCGGSRFRNEALDTRIGGRHIAQLLQLSVREACEFLASLEFLPSQQVIAQLLLGQIGSRLNYLVQVRLEYLTLDRPLSTLSGGESQRVALTSALGSSLVNMLYVLDEPTAGLHPFDTMRLVEVILGLRDRGNTVVAVEHDASVIRSADRVIEIGPGAGERGGEITFQGCPAQLLADSHSLTAEYLAGRRGAWGTKARRTISRGVIRLCGARGRNLQNLTVDFPLGMLCVVTGVSGSGKSTLVEDTLYPALCARLSKSATAPLAFDELIGVGQIEDAILVDQSPIGRSPRSNPATHIKAFDEIRAVFAETLEARTLNYTAGHFSFNSELGRCPKCQGDGCLQIDMQFLADIYLPCDECQATRYRREVLQVQHRGRNIAEVLELTVREAFAFFRGRTKLQARLKRLIDVGLDYLRLGQPANTLSGGESQRLKLAGYLSAAKRGRSLFLLDEPTTGLHFADIVQLLDCFDALLAIGHSLIVVEHNLQLIQAADHVIDLGPGAAQEGGRIVAHGTPEELAARIDSATGRCLASLQFAR